MQASSLDLRARVAAACAAGQRSIPEVAAQFSVSVSFVHKLLRRQRTSGSLAALPHRGGPAPTLDEAAHHQLAACLTQQPDATLDELRVRLAASGGPAVGRTSVWQAVQRLNWQRKKESARRRAGKGLTPGICGSVGGRRRHPLQVR